MDLSWTSARPLRLVKGLIRKAVGLAGVEIVRKHLSVPCATLDATELLLAYCLASSEPRSLVQVGACDGTSSDSAYPFLRHGAMRAVLVEPISESFQRLENAYRDVPNVHLCNAALGAQSGTAVMYRVKPEGRWKDSKWARQWASFDYGHLLAHGVKPDEVERVEVRTITFAALMLEYNLNQIDILLVDAEGFDAEVVKMALAIQVPPQAITFERTHVGSQALAEGLFSLFKEKGYRWIHDEYNTLAVHETFVSRWRRKPPMTLASGANGSGL